MPRSRPCSNLLAKRGDRRADDAQLNFALGKALEQREQYAERIRALRKGQRAAATRRAIRYREFRTPHDAHSRVLRWFFAERAGGGDPSSRSDLHRWPATLRLHAGGADPRQPLARGRHHGAAEHHQHHAPVRRHARQPRTAIPRRVGTAPARTPERARPPLSRRKRRRCAPDANTSPTSCPTTSATSG